MGTRNAVTMARVLCAASFSKDCSIAENQRLPMRGQHHAITIAMVRISQSSYAFQKEIMVRNAIAMFAWPKEIGQVTFHVRVVDMSTEN
jgi:hypothetical protein